MVFCGFLALFLCDTAQLLIPSVLGEGLDMMGAPGALLSDLRTPVAKILGLASVVALTRFAWRNLIIGFSRRVERALRDRLYEKIVKLSPRWHLENASGDLMAMATGDVESVRMALSAGMISMTDTTVMGCVSLGFMISISPSMTLWALLPMPVITLATHFMGRRIYKLVLEVQNVFGQLTETVREHLSGLRVVRAMGLSHLSLAEVERAGRRYMDINVRQATLAGTFFPFLHFMSNLAVALVIYFGGRETIMGHVSVGDFVAFVTYLAMLTWPLMALGMIIGFVQQGLASLNRLGRVFSAEEDEENAARKPAPPRDAPLDIELINLSFKYPSREKRALKNISLTLPHNAVTALVGPMGGGKSTLAALLPALYEAAPASLKAAGRWVEDWPLADLRARFGYVPQDGFMFSASLFENLVFGKPEATEEEALDAARLAGLADDIEGFPDGLHTMVGERGVTLSGGQRQRLALARALILDPDFLIMDDTLSAVDAAVEAEIMNRLLARRKGRGALIISHRLSSLMGVDRALVLENGRITEEGSPDELMTRESYFRRIVELNHFAASEGANVGG